MIRDDLEGVDESVLELIVDQAEKRLSAQCAFADAQDQRGTALVNAAAALAAAAVALGGGSIAALGETTPVAIGGFVAMLGFTVAACIGLWALKSSGFHAVGFYPNDFTEDAQKKRTLRELREDFILDLQGRLTENGTSLDRRGRRIDRAAIAMILTPVAAMIAAYVLG